MARNKLASWIALHLTLGRCVQTLACYSELSAESCAWSQERWRWQWPVMMRGLRKDCWHDDVIIMSTVDTVPAVMASLRDHIRPHVICQSVTRTSLLTPHRVVTTDCQTQELLPWHLDPCHLPPPAAVDTGPGAVADTTYVKGIYTHFRSFKVNSSSTMK